MEGTYVLLGPNDADQRRESVGTGGQNRGWEVQKQGGEEQESILAGVGR